MKVSGFTIARNAIKFNYPIIESIQSILPICDEFIINVGDSEDDTLGLIKSIEDSKIKIIESEWNMSLGKEVLSSQTNIALKECKGDWAFYLQTDEVVHENDLQYLRNCMQENLYNKDADALRFQWLHFYGSYFRYRIDSGWYQKQDRIIRNNGLIESCGDAYSFKRKDDKPFNRINTKKFIYHYGWVHSEDLMTQRRVNAEEIGFTSLEPEERESEYSYGDLNRFPVYFGSHPNVMEERIEKHDLSQRDWGSISNKYWWHPAKIFRIRYKTSKRIKEKIV